MKGSRFLNPFKLLYSIVPTFSSFQSNPKLEILKTFVLYTGIGYINSFMSINVINPLKSAPPLPDVLFGVLPNIPDWVPHSMLFCLTLLTLYKLRKSGRVLIQMYNRISLLFVLRVLCFTFTPLPPPVPGCVARLQGEAFHWNVVRDLIQSRGLTCSDMMFSGHAIHFIAFMWVLWPGSTFWRKVALLTYVSLGLISIIASHLHYTADVLVGIFLTVLMFRMN